MITFIKDKQDNYDVRTTNGQIFLGQIYREVDGFYVYSPNRLLGGCMTETFLRLVADQLKTINRDWNERIARDLS